MIGPPASGVPAADYGSHFSGSGDTLQCTFFRMHKLLLEGNLSNAPVGDFNLATIWMKDGVGAV